MKAKELHAMTAEELAQKLDDAYEELFNLRFQFSSGQLKDFNRLTALRRDIARLKTIMRERELARLREGGEV